MLLIKSNKKFEKNKMEKRKFFFQKLLKKTNTFQQK